MFYITDANGNRAVAFEGGAVANMEVVTEAKTLTVEDSGKVFALTAAAGADITLPAVAKGLCYKFYVGSSFATTDWTITAASKVIQGSVVCNAAYVTGVNEDIITLVKAKAAAGDYIELVSDGTNWYVSGNVVVVAGITLTASA